MCSDQRHRPRLLVVDDHEDSRDILELALSAEFEVVTVADGEAALAQVRARGPFDAVLTDLTLPGMSGEQLANKLRAEPALRPRRLIAVSGRDVRSDIKELFDKTISKPIDVEALPRMLSQLLGAPAAESTAPAAWPPRTKTRPINVHNALESGLSSEQMRLLLTNAPNLMLRTDVAGTVTWCNPSWLRFTGQHRQSGLGESFLDQVHPDCRERAALWLQAVQHEPEGRELSFRLKRYDGEYRWLRAHVSSLPAADGQEPTLLLSCVDIDDGKRADEAKSRFLSTMAHEIRTPLTPMGAYLHQLGKLSARNEPTPPELLTKLSRQVERVAQLADFLSDAGRVDTGTPLSLAPELVDLGALIDAVVEEQRAIVANKRSLPDLSIRYQAPETPLKVLADRQRITQAVRHILHNAIKFSPHAGTVDVTLSEQRASHGKSYIIEVRDQGIGIPHDELSQVGSNYFRASNAKLANYPGVGLGLALTQHILHGHGGTMTLESSPHGTTVRLTLQD